MHCISNYKSFNAYNWLLLVSGPELAILKMPLPVCDKNCLNSSLKAPPQ